MDTAKAFRAAALIEALTWIGLLIGMGFKYVWGHHEIGVKIMGPIHGIAFMTYVGLTLLSAREYAWSKKLLLVGLAASIPPAFTLPFERYVFRRGHLVEAAPAAA